jgi:uncharacterized protein
MWMALKLLLFCSVPILLHGQALPLADGAEVKRVYGRLLEQIRKIPIFDTHAHPGFVDDPDVDAMTSPPGAEALRTRADNPELVAAAKALFGYPYADLGKEHAKWLADKKKSLKGPGQAYFNNILDKVGIDQSVANRVAMAPYLDPKRFRWVPFADSFLFPFDNGGMIARNPDQQVFIPMQEKKLKREMQGASIAGLPDALDGYLAFIRRTLADEKKAGAIAIKFEAAYFRSLRFGDPLKENAAAIYAKYKTGGQPEMAEYTAFQDYIFRYLLQEAGRLKLPVHIHTAVGVGDYFSLDRGNVLNLENILRDPRYTQVTFVLIHGGYPRDREAIWLAARQNVYLDSSFMELLLYPSEFAHVLKRWFEIFPEKVVFGSDCFPYNETLGAEESYWLAVESGRTALAAALAEMVVLKEITEARALEIGRAYLHDTSIKIHSL